MTVWIAFAAMTAAAIFIVLAPLARAGGRLAATAGSGSQVYRDQLAEIDRDLDAGLIGETEAAAARLEVSRRLIAASAAEQAASGGGDGTARRRAVALAAFVAVPLVAVLAYAPGGRPDLPGQPLSQRLQGPPDRNDVAGLVARVEAHLAANPEDGRGWELVAPAYLHLGRIADAVRARATALRLLGSTPDRETDLAEALMFQAQGVVTAEAKAALARAVALDGDHPKAGYLIGLAAEQDGNPQEAVRVWTRLMQVAPEGAPWLALLRQEITRLGGTPPQTPRAPAPAGPPVAAAPSTPQVAMPPVAMPPAAMPPATADAVRGMVDGLAARLAADGSDFDGWLRLVRSYAVLGEGAKAREAAARARERFGSETDKMARLDELVRELGIGG